MIKQALNFVSLARSKEEVTTAYIGAWPLLRLASIIIVLITLLYGSIAELQVNTHYDILYDYRHVPKNLRVVLWLNIFDVAVCFQGRCSGAMPSHPTTS